MYTRTYNFLSQYLVKRLSQFKEKRKNYVYTYRFEVLLKVFTEYKDTFIIVRAFLILNRMIILTIEIGLH